MSACSYQIDGLILDLLESRHLSSRPQPPPQPPEGGTTMNARPVMRGGVGSGNATRGSILYRGRPRVVGPASARLRIHRLVCYDTYVSVLVLRIIDGRDPIDINHVRRRRKRGPYY
jgi:hypothetical protein